VSLRSGWYATNTIRAWGAQIRAGDVVRGPYAAFEDRWQGRAWASCFFSSLRRMPRVGASRFSFAYPWAKTGSFRGRSTQFSPMPSTA
jgi:hypothetical protein